MTNGNDAAFSRGGFALDPDSYDLGATGLTKREYFAAMAMQGMMASPNIVEAVTEQLGEDGHSLVKTIIAAGAVVFAEALIEELNKENK